MDCGHRGLRVGQSIFSFDMVTSTVEALNVKGKSVDALNVGVLNLSVGHGW